MLSKKPLMAEIKAPTPHASIAAAPCRADGIECRLAGSVSIGVGVENWLHQRLQIPFDNHLRDPVGHRVGIPSGRVRPSPFGMSTRRTSGGT
jgi:hypothetical protein